jgi:tetratricopeptide (TPR) repeat protein
MSPADPAPVLPANDVQSTAIPTRSTQAKRSAVPFLVGSILTVLFALVFAGMAWLESVRDARRDEIARALADARWRLGRAQSAPVGNMRAWDDALKAAQRSQPLVQGGLIDSTTRQDVENFVGDVANEHLMAKHAADIAWKERGLLERLTEIQTLRGGRFDDEANLEPEFERAFRAAELDPQRTAPKDLGALIRARNGSVPAELGAALEAWGAYRRSKRAGEWKVLVEAARQGDADRGRTDLRLALASDDWAAVKKLAAAANIDRLPGYGAIQLARIRDELGDHDGAIAALRSAARRFPTEPWLNFELAQRLGSLSGPASADALRYYAAFRALRPEAAHAMGHYLDAQNQGDEALAVFRDLARRRPDVGRHHLCLADALKKRGDQPAARAALDAAVGGLRKLVKQYSDDAALHCDLGIALKEQGDAKAATTELQEALRLDPDDGRAKKFLGQ